MILTVDQDSEHYDADKNARATIYLNGEEVKYCTYANEESGVVTRYIPEDDPRFTTAGGFWPTEELSGKVEIKFDVQGT